jgi:hypothetical protein
MFLIGYDSIWIEKQLLMKFVVFWMIDIKKVWIRHKKYIYYIIIRIVMFAKDYTKMMNTDK